MLVDISKLEAELLDDFWYLLEGDLQAHPADHIINNLICQVKYGACSVPLATVTLPGPDDEPNVEVPQAGWLD